ncbi:MAG: hypothetical protein SFT81_07175, partial [Candidatus Caenarcaniphilales bacterium]|nr:hypothetical protein [Candidatus Caenarcaniphilales bacterium]
MSNSKTTFNRKISVVFALSLLLNLIIIGTSFAAGDSTQCTGAFSSNAAVNCSVSEPDDQEAIADDVTKHTKENICPDGKTPYDYGVALGKVSGTVSAYLIIAVVIPGVYTTSMILALIVITVPVPEPCPTHPPSEECCYCPDGTVPDEHQTEDKVCSDGSIKHCQVCVPSHPESPTVTQSPEKCECPYYPPLDCPPELTHFNYDYNYHCSDGTDKKCNREGCKPNSPSVKPTPSLIQIHPSITITPSFIYIPRSPTRTYHSGVTYTPKPSTTIGYPYTPPKTYTPKPPTPKPPTPHTPAPTPKPPTPHTPPK